MSGRKPIGPGAVMIALTCAVAGAWAAGTRGAETRAAGDGTDTAVVRPAAQLAWSESPLVKGAKMAVLWGDPGTGAYGALRRLPGGASIAAHSHGSSLRTVIVSGTMVLTVGHDAPVQLGPGSYVSIPAGVVHSPRCATGADCTYFEEQPGASDMKFVEGPAARK
jgi:quercetin dioxygenase-like cupin family protein